MNLELCNRLRLYLILETSQIRLPLGDFIMQAVEGGVTAVQLRDKERSEADRYAAAKKIASLLKGTDTLFIVNNSPDIALSVGAHGVHLGAEDIPAHAVRKIFPELIIGYSCNNLSDVAAAVESGAGYAGIGPAFPTATKKNHRPVLNPGGVGNIAGRLKIPSVAIGGINIDNICEFKGSGISGIAVSSALCKSESPYETAFNMRRAVDGIIAE